MSGLGIENRGLVWRALPSGERLGELDWKGKERLRHLFQPILRGRKVP
jgi:hypothetical protein